MHDLAIIAVSTNESHWIRAMLPTVWEHIGDIDADVVIVDNDSTDGVADMVAAEFPWARTVWSANHGFGHANNRGVGHAERFEFTEAATDFDEVVRLAPDWLPGRINLGIALMSLARDPQASDERRKEGNARAL